MLREIMSCGAAAMVVCGARVAAAQGGPEERSVVIVVEGRDGEEIAADLGARVGAPYSVHEPKAFRAALAKQGTTALAPAAGSRARGQQLVHRAYEAALRANADAAIMVSVQKGRTATRVHVWGLDVHALGASLDREVALRADADAHEEADAAWSAAAGLLGAAPASNDAPQAKAVAPAPPASEDRTPETARSAPVSAPPAVPPPEEDRAAAPAAVAGPTRATAMLVVQAALEGGTRSFSYVDRITPSLRPYTLDAAPLASISAELYPFARTTTPGVSGLGLAINYARAFGLSSADSSGARVDTSWQSYGVDLVERVPVSRAITLGAHVGYTAIDFAFDRGAAVLADAALPAVSYRAIRVGPDVRATLGDFAVFGGGSYLGVLGTGALGGLFPNASVGGVEGHLGVGYALARSVEVSLGVSHTRMFYDLKPTPGDPNVAGGALDELTRLSAAIAYFM